MQPLTPAELEQLIPTDLPDRAGVLAHEKEALLHARRWALGHRRKVDRILTEPFLRELHRRMFGTTWRWAGEYRTTPIPLGVAPEALQEAISTTIKDTTRDLHEEYYTNRPLAARYHHRLLVLRPFTAGNGRWSRLATDALLLALREPMPTWGMIDHPRSTRGAYLEALKQADRGEFDPLFRFMWA
jgi:Fic-DOC domain mobile mystery protein B